MSQDIIRLLQKNADQIGSVFSFDLNGKASVVSDCSADNSDLQGLNLRDTAAYEKYSKQFREKAGARAAVGGYLEKRVIYEPKALFKKEEEARNIHLGIDVSTDAGAALFAPLDGTIHSFANNDFEGDYGPCIILKHKIENTVFHTLYGHLSLDSLNGLWPGRKFEKGEYLARVGNFPANGDWPPHLHFQLVVDMQEKQGDYPGVCSASTLEFYKSNCPDPNLILQIDKL